MNCPQRAHVFFPAVQTTPEVIQLKNEKDLLGSLLKTAQMGQTGIRCAKRGVQSPGLRDILHNQELEYDAVEREAHRLAAQRGFDLQPLSQAAQAAASLMTRMQLSVSASDAQVAAMLIQGCTRGRIKCLKNLHQCSQAAEPSLELTQRLLNLQARGIREAESFL